MNKKIICFGIISLFILSALTSLPAMTIKQNQKRMVGVAYIPLLINMWEFQYENGVNLYYGQPVLLHYSGTETWVLNKNKISPGWYKIIQNLKQICNAEVYDATSGTPFTDSNGHTGLKGDLIENNLNFKVTQLIRGYSNENLNHYKISNLDDSIFMNYHKIITGRYHLWGMIINEREFYFILFP